nr:TRAP transporter large permease subunit [Sinobaca sp. H24]
MVIIILWGILGGYFTPTEAAVVAVIYALVIGGLIYRELKWREVPKILADTIIATAAILLLVGFANLFGWILVSEGIPTAVAESILSVSENPILITLLLLLLLIVVGMFLERLPLLLFCFQCCFLLLHLLAWIQCTLALLWY